MPIVSLLVCITLVSVVVGLVTILALLWTLPSTSRSHVCTEICLPCKALHISQKLCCGCESSRLSQYLEKVVQTQYDDIISDEELRAKSAPEPSIALKKLHAKTRWTIKPAARYSGTLQPQTRPYDAGLIPLRAWKMGQRSFRRYGMKYRNGRLVVPIPGIYNVYSYLDLYEPFVSKIINESNAGSIIHRMIRYNIIDGKEEVLVSKVHSHEVPQNGFFNIYDSYLSAVVDLNAGDEISVQISNMSLVTNPSSNYFGVHMIYCW